MDASEMMDNDTQEPAGHRSGFVAIMGKPNAGKSTLMNALVGEKLSIATPKAQTTRHRVIGIFSDDDCQVIFLDTPGLINPKYALQRSMVQSAEKAGRDADIILFLVETGEDRLPEEAFESFKRSGKPVILGVNKIDLDPKMGYEQMIEGLLVRFPFKEVFRLSALTGAGTEHLMEWIKQNIPLGPAFYPKENLSEHPERFFVEELIREQIFLQYRQEIPYNATVSILQYDDQPDLATIEADIIVGRDGHKGIIIGKGGAALKKLGMAARLEIEQFVGKQVHLKLFVKVRSDWRDHEGFVRSYGY
jgi:GTP-binding protein Era